MIRWSNDGNSFGPETVFVECAGVPSIASTNTGMLVAAFQWFPLTRADAFDRVAVRFSETGGVSWSDPVPIEVNGLPSNFQRPFDPTIVALPDKGFRLYYSDGPKGQPGPPGTGSNVTTYSARSEDGVHYTFEPGERFLLPGHRAIDCAVAYQDKQWFYVAPIGRPDEGAYAAQSLDGLAFTRLKDIPSSNNANWTGNLLSLGDRLCFYGCGQQGIWWSERNPAGQWKAPMLTGVNGGDPAIARGKDGKLVMVYVSAPRRNIPNPIQARRP